MSSLTSTEIIALVFVVVLAVIVVGLFVYLIRRLRSRRAKLLSDLEDRPQLNQDRAFNRLSMARREAGILAAQGVDVHRAQELIAESQGAFDTRQYDRSYRVAQSAHEALVNARQHGTMTPGAPLPSKGPAASAPPDTSRLPSGATSTSEPPPSATPPIPKNRAESQFQMRLLSDELSALGGARARDPVGRRGERAPSSSPKRVRPGGLHRGVPSRPARSADARRVGREPPGRDGRDQLRRPGPAERECHDARRGSDSRIGRGFRALPGLRLPGLPGGFLLSRLRPTSSPPHLPELRSRSGRRRSILRALRCPIPVTGAFVTKR